MFYFLCRPRFNLLHGIGIGIGRQTISASQSSKLFVFMFSNDPSPLFRVSNTESLRWMTTGSNQESLTASYLINKLGFPPESALKVSQYAHLKSPDNADTVISFLEKHGFSQSQIKAIVRKQPRLLTSDVEKTFLPKLEYLLSKGFSRPDLAKFISHYPIVLVRSLERHIIPVFNTYTNLVLSDEKTVKAIKQYPFLFSFDIEIFNGKLLHNINILRDHGVPESNIIKMLYQYPGSLFINPGSFKEIVEEVEEIGLDPLTLNFVRAVYVFAAANKSIRDRKVDAFKKWGWSDKEIWDCFRKYPFYFVVSEEMIMAKMDFLVNKMGIDSPRVVKQPSVLTRGFQTKIVPRGLIAQHLLSKGFIKKDFSLSSLFDSSEKQFLKYYITPHVAKASDLLKVYKQLRLRSSL